jgi:signal transduction histidine kinase
MFLGLSWIFNVEHGLAQCSMIDSLQRVLLLQRDTDTSRINTMNLLALEFVKTEQTQRGLFYAQQAYYLSQRLKYKTGEGDYQMVLGAIYYQDDLKRDKEAIESYLKGLEIFQQIQHKPRIADAHKTIGDYYYNLFYTKENHYEKALSHYLQYLEITKNIDDKVKLAEAYITVANLYNHLGKSVESHDYFLKAIEVKKQIENQDLHNPHLFTEAERFYTLQIENQKLYNYILIGGLALLLVIALLLFFLTIQKQRVNKTLRVQKKEIEKQNKDIESKNIALKLQTEEISNQRDLLATQNAQIVEARNELDTANDSLKRMVEQLEQIVQTRTEDLRKANHSLVVANEELDTLIYRASHDFKGPVATLTGLSQLGKLECPTNMTAIDFFDKIEHTATKMDAMLQKLHQVSYLIAKPLENQIISVEKMIEDIKVSLADLMETYQVELQLIVEPALYLFSDIELMSIILENLIENAVYFRNQEANTQPVISIEVKQDVHYVYWVVKDNGAGIPQEFFPKIFDMFFRGSEASRGNGLGLYVVKKALERLEGKVDITSEVGQYTAFHMVLEK